MTQWVELEDGRRWELRRPTELTNTQLARACKDVGLSPDRLGAVLTEDEGTPEAQADRLLAMAVVVYASRKLAGDDVRTVDDANDFPADGWTITDDEPPPEPEDPTSPADDADGND